MLLYKNGSLLLGHIVAEDPSIFVNMVPTPVESTKSWIMFRNWDFYDGDKASVISSYFQDVITNFIY